MSVVEKKTVDHKVCIMVLYLLIWGEAANICFLPERLCYFFYHVSQFCGGPCAVLALYK